MLKSTKTETKTKKKLLKNLNFREKKIKQTLKSSSSQKNYLVNIRHNNVAERIIKRCDSADCERCMARFKSFCVVSVCVCG